jgi:hypothetical protein
MKVMKRLMEYCVETKECGLILKPDAKWDGNKRCRNSEKRK